jgi:hypothetical protein
MNYLKNIGLAVIVLTSLAACKKSFLDVPINKEVVAEDYVTDLTRSEEYLNGIFLLIARDMTSYEIYPYADLAADNLKVFGSFMTTHYQWNQNLDRPDDNRDNFWRQSYHIIRSCNFLLEIIDKFRAENPVKADAIKGQAYAIRAMIHENLVKVFAQPMIFTGAGTHAGIFYDSVFAQTEQITRQPVVDVYAHIIRDYSRAIQLIPSSLKGVMPANITAQTWVSQQAAMAMLARSYFYKGDMSQAQQTALTVIQGATLMTGADYPSKLFTSKDKESLFWSPPLETSQGSSGTSFQGGSFVEDNFLAATADLVNLIDEQPNDKRKQWFAKFPSGNWQVAKYPVGAVAGLQYPPGAYYQTHIRTSELYLMAAECFARNGNEDSARHYLDTIRKRANNTANPTLVSGAALLDSICKERRKELCFENNRLFDLLRLGQTITRIDVVSPAPTQLSFPNNKAVAPIPRIDAIQIPLNQNPGYE